MLATAADEQDVAVFGEGWLELPGFEEVSGRLEYCVHRKYLSLCRGTMRPTIQHLTRGGVTKTVPPRYKMQKI